MVGSWTQARRLDWTRFGPVAVNAASLLALGWFALFLGTWARGLDAWTFYTFDPSDPYRNAVLNSAGGFHYAPAFAQLLAVLQNLPWQAFHTLFSAVELGALAVLVGPPLALLLAVLQVPLVWADLEWGNVNLLAAMLLVLAIRRPYLWAPLLLLKATPVVGLVWYVVRREWGRLAIAVGATVAVIALSVAIGGFEHWLDWYRLVLRGNDSVADSYNAIPLLARGLLAVGVVAWGGLNNRTWTVPLGAAIAVPIFDPGFVIVLGVVYLARRQEAAT